MKYEVRIEDEDVEEILNPDRYITRCEYSCLEPAAPHNYVYCSNGSIRMVILNGKTPKGRDKTTTVTTPCPSCKGTGKKLTYLGDKLVALIGLIGDNTK